MASCSLAIVGDGAVGKSSIISSFQTNGFQLSNHPNNKHVYKQTIGFDVYEKKLRIRDIDINLFVWDIGGQSIHSKNLDKYLSSATAIFLVYDVTNTESYLNLDDWYRNVKKYAKGAQSIYLIGNKIDLLNLRQVTDEQHQAFIRKMDLQGGMFLSAKTGDNVVKTFYQIAAEASGVRLTDGELATYNKVLTAYIQTSDDSAEGRTAFADDIEREDLEAERKKKEQCNCIIS